MLYIREVHLELDFGQSKGIGNNNSPYACNPKRAGQIMLIIRQNELQMALVRKTNKIINNDKRINLSGRTLEIYMLHHPELLNIKYIQANVTRDGGEVNNNTMTKWGFEYLTQNNGQWPR